MYDRQAKIVKMKTLVVLLSLLLCASLASALRVTLRSNSKYLGKEPSDFEVPDDVFHDAPTPAQTPEKLAQYDPPQTEKMLVEWDHNDEPHEIAQQPQEQMTNNHEAFLRVDSGALPKGTQGSGQSSTLSPAAAPSKDTEAGKAPVPANGSTPQAYDGTSPQSSPAPQATAGAPQSSPAPTPQKAGDKSPAELMNEIVKAREAGKIVQVTDKGVVTPGAPETEELPEGKAAEKGADPEKVGAPANEKGKAKAGSSPKPAAKKKASADAGSTRGGLASVAAGSNTEAKEAKRKAAEAKEGKKETKPKPSPAAEADKVMPVGPDAAKAEPKASPGTKPTKDSKNPASTKKPSSATQGSSGPGRAGTAVPGPKPKASPKPKPKPQPTPFPKADWDFPDMRIKGQDPPPPKPAPGDAIGDGITQGELGEAPSKVNEHGEPLARRKQPVINVDAARKPKSSPKPSTKPKKKPVGRSIDDDDEDTPIELQEKHQRTQERMDKQDKQLRAAMQAMKEQAKAREAGKNSPTAATAKHKLRANTTSVGISAFDTKITGKFSIGGKLRSRPGFDIVIKSNVTLEDVDINMRCRSEEFTMDSVTTVTGIVSQVGTMLTLNENLLLGGSLRPGQVSTPTDKMSITGDCIVYGLTQAPLCKANKAVRSRHFALAQINPLKTALAIPGHLVIQNGTISTSKFLGSDYKFANAIKVSKGISTPELKTNMIIPGPSGKVMLGGKTFESGTLYAIFIGAEVKKIDVKGDITVEGNITARRLSVRRIVPEGGVLTLTNNLRIPGSLNVAAIGSPTGNLMIDGNLEITGTDEGASSFLEVTTKVLETPIAAADSVSGLKGMIQFPGGIQAKSSVHSTGLKSSHMHLGGVEQWRLAYHQNFESSQHDSPMLGWSFIETTACTPGSGRFLGGHCSAGNDRQPDVHAVINNLPPHTHLMLKANIHFLDSWEGETAFASIDNERVWADTHTMPGNGKGMHVCGSSEFPESRMSAPIQAVIPHFSSDVRIGFGSTLDESSCNESWGLDNVMIYVK
eukprot:GFYU01005511.1.p1 GENE.GFYU01005511.1~~GFYU01005511.1.p1  ORF type:complete len:1031 (-),score=304.70 GFYU01005511.1:806-3898(-)